MGEKAAYFAARLKELREQAGLSQAQLGELAGLAQRTVSHLEQGRNEPSWPTAVKLAEALGVDCRAFLEEPERRKKSGRGRPKKGE